MTRTASTTPAHRSWSSTSGASKARGCDAADGLTHRTKCALDALSSASSELRSLTKRLPTEEKDAALRLALAAASMPGRKSDWSSGTSEAASWASQSSCRVSLFLSRKETWGCEREGGFTNGSPWGMETRLASTGVGGRGGKGMGGRRGWRAETPGRAGRGAATPVARLVGAGRLCDDCRRMVGHVSRVVAHDEALLVPHAPEPRGGQEAALGVQLVQLLAEGLLRGVGRLALGVEQPEDAVWRLLQQVDARRVVLILDLLPRDAL
eukprot:scaffold14350_cov98-Isochrysis_galbana.AAC.7